MNQSRRILHSLLAGQETRMPDSEAWVQPGRQSLPARFVRT